MLVAVISDTHLPRGSRRLPERCLARLREAELILHAGDFSAAAVHLELGALGPPLLGVHGNVDEPALAEQLPAQLELEIDQVRIAMTHDGGPAKGRMNRLRKRFPRADAVIFGHSHIPLLEVDESFQIFNPGSPTDRRRQPEHTMGLASIDGRSISFEHVPLGPRAA